MPDFYFPLRSAPQQLPDGLLRYYCSSFTVTGPLHHYHPHHHPSDEPSAGLWSASKHEVGFTPVPPVEVQVVPGASLPSIPQYPLKPEAEKGITALVESFLQQGILVPCQSPCNTPILPVPKPGRKEWRLVQDLRQINKILNPLHPIVPNPATILSHIPPDSCVFTLIDLQHAFFAIPLAKESQYLFTFTFQGRQYTWTRLPQGFIHSPTLFSQTLHHQLQSLELLDGSTIIQYVDDLLVPSTNMRITPHSTTGLSAAEIVYGKPNRTPWDANTSPPTQIDLHIMGDEMQKHFRQLTSSLKFLHSQVQCAFRPTPRTPGQDSDPQDNFPGPQTGDFVLIRNWDRPKLGPRWKGPFQVLLQTPTAIKVQGHSRWIHISDVKTWKPTTTDKP
ncbi:uncharacterized protein LOC144507477 [Mustelus asterias]